MTSHHENEIRAIFEREIATAEENHEPTPYMQWLCRLRNEVLDVIRAAGGTRNNPERSRTMTAPQNPDVAAVTIAARFARAGMTDAAIEHWFTVENPWIEAAPVDALEAGRVDDVIRAADRLVPEAP